MKTILENAKRNSINRILNAVDWELESQDFSEIVVKNYAPKHLEFIGEKVVHDVEKISMHDYMRENNKGGIYAGGTAERVKMTKEVGGSWEVFEFMAKNSLLPNVSWLHGYGNSNNKGIEYVGYGMTITNNAKVIAELKADSDEKFESIVPIFNKANGELEKFKKDELTPLVKQTIQEEIKRRQAKKATLEELK